MLQRVASRLQAKVREGDIVARIGGDEFVVVQTMIDSPGAMEALAERLIGAISQPYVIEDRTFTIGASIGIAAHSLATESVADLLSAADRALYHAKARAKGSAIMARPDAPDTPHLGALDADAELGGEELGMFENVVVTHRQAAQFGQPAQPRQRAAVHLGALDGSSGE